MGRRGKGKKNSSSHEDAGSGDDEKIPVQKRRGRPQKLPKDEIDGVEMIEDGEMDDAKTDNSEKYNKRKRNLREKSDSVKEDAGAGMIPSTDDDSSRTNGFRHNGSRRKQASPSC